MELVVSHKGLMPLTKQHLAPLDFNNEGILHSTYKDETCENYFHSNPESIFGTKQRLKSQIYTSQIGIASLLKFSVFATIIAIMVS